MIQGKRLIIGAAILAIAAGCSSNSKYSSNNSDASSIATSAARSGAAFGSRDGLNWQEKALLAKRTYYFGFDRYEVTEDDQNALNVHAKYLGNNPDSRLRIEGHTDEKGSREYNVGLGERRASAIHRYLTAKGVDGSQLSEVSYGKEKLADPRDTSEAHERNRRAYLVYEAT